MKNKKEEYLLRMDRDLFFQISEFVQQMKKTNGRSYSINKFIVDAIEKNLILNNKNIKKNDNK